MRQDYGGKFDAFRRQVKFKIFRRVQIMILFFKGILPGVGAVDYRPHCVLISAQTLMCSVLLQTAMAYDYTYMLLEWFAQIRDPHVFCSPTNESL